ncbi:MAG: hypothetical protein IPL32_17845 [Chloracidobacterium sp.]|nr:hypothetical protein [Chloracidobacterium sp.]
MSFDFSSGSLTSNGTTTSVPPYGSGENSSTNNFSTKLSDGRLFVGGSWWNTGSYDETTYLGTYSSGTNTYSWVQSTDLPAAMAWGGAGDFNNVNSCVTLPDGRICVWSNHGNCQLGTVSSNTITWATCTQSGWSQGAGWEGWSYDVLNDGRLIAVTSNGTYYYLGVVSGDTITWTAATTVNLPSEFGKRVTLRVFPNRVIGCSVLKTSTGYLTSGHLQEITVSGDTLTFSTLCDKPSALASYDEIFDLFQLQSGKLVLVSSRANANTTDAIFIGQDAANLDSYPTVTSTVTAALDPGIFADLSASSTALATLSDSLIALEAALSCSPPSLIATLDGRFYAALSATQSIFADLTDYVPPTAYLAAQLKTQSEVFARLSTGVGFSASLTCASTAESSLLSQIRIAANLSAQAALTADVVTQIRLAAALDQLSTLVTELTTQITMESDLSAAASCRAYLIVPTPEEMQQCYVLTPEHAEVCYGI